jgi:DNA (cytosine-5)-methyltransferase 1
MTAFYNEIDPYAAAWLRNLIAAGHIAPGVVDERSIEDIHPEELHGFTQCHFFAGIGVWSLALRSAGWPDSRPIWTGSCPCQPFSAAGKGAGFADERHLWPTFHHLIAECRPPVVLGEQVASAAVDAWIDLVHADLEALGYAFGSVPFPSAGVGAPHIRDRNYWVAYTDGGTGGQGRAHVRGRTAGGDAQPRAGLGSGGLSRRLDNTNDPRLEGQRGRYQAEGGRIAAAGPVAATGESNRVAYADGGLGDTDREPAGRHTGTAHATQARHGAQDSNDNGPRHASGGLGAERPGPVNGYWRDADWLGCRDGKWRPVEPGTFPLAHGAAARVGRLRAYGNAINAEAARVFIECVMESL